MTPEQFVYWLQGFLEVSDPKALDERQTQILKDHMALVLKKETPIRPAVIPTPSLGGGKLCAPAKKGGLSKDLEALAKTIVKDLVGEDGFKMPRSWRPRKNDPRSVLRCSSGSDQTDTRLYC